MDELGRTNWESIKSKSSIQGTNREKNLWDESSKGRIWDGSGGSRLVRFQPYRSIGHHLYFLLHTKYSFLSLVFLEVVDFTSTNIILTLCFYLSQLHFV